MMKKTCAWKTFDFGPEIKPHKYQSSKEISQLEKVTSNISSTSKLSNTKKTVHNIFNRKESYDFHKNIIPKNVSELIVHQKKIKEVEDWIKFNISPDPNRKNKARFLLLSGPTGSGKTTTVQVLCKEMNISVSEWINPVDIDFELLRGPNQVDKFLDFFTESKYNTLFDTSENRKIILIKDFPNVFINHPEEFHNALEECFYKSVHPVIFIVTEAANSKINLQRTLFPEDILIKYQITHYSFNACAPTLLKSVLKRAQIIIKEHSNIFKQPSPSTIEAILASSMGDIRSVINQFYVASLKNSDDLPTKPATDKPSGKRKRSNQGLTLKSMVRDETLGLFHGLGRVLNPKRIPHENSWRLNCDLEKLIDEFSTQPLIFHSFLFENYLKYFGDIDDVCKACETLSVAVQFSENWESHEVLLYGLWLSVLGLMISNEHKVSKWNQIRGPKKIEQSVHQRDKLCTMNSTDYFYFNCITKSEKYHKFNLSV